MNASVKPELQLTDQQPWPGLRAFSEGNADYFFGRTREIKDLKRAVKRNTLTVLFGKSGLGKSSILQAGLSPALREEHFIPIYIRLNHFDETLPLEDQVEVFLEEAIDAHDIDAPRPVREETLWEYFHKQDVEWWSRDNHLLKPVLIFDQFEEIITTGQKDINHAQRCSQFLEELEDLIENRPPAKLLKRFAEEKGLARNYDLDRLDYRVVISLREDYLADLESLRERLRSVMANRYRLYPLSETQGLDVILKPGKHLVEEQEARQIIDFVAHQAGVSIVSESDTAIRRHVEPSLLCVIMRELNNQRIATGQDKISADLIREKRPEKIMREFYEKGVSGLGRHVREFIENQLLTASGARNRVAEDDAIQRFNIPASAIAKLIDRRIIQRERVANQSWIELSHDTLIPVVSRSAEANRRQQTFNRRAAWAAGAMALLVAIIVGGYLFQKQWQEEQTREAANLSLALVNQLKDSQSVSLRSRQQLAESLTLNFEELIDKAPDSELIKLRYAGFLSEVADMHFEQLQLSPAERAARSALAVLPYEPGRRFADADVRHVVARTLIENARAAFYRENYAEAGRHIEESLRLLDAESLADNPEFYWRALTHLSAQMLRARILVGRYDYDGAYEKILAIQQRARDVLASITAAPVDDGSSMTAHAQSRLLTRYYILLLSSYRLLHEFESSELYSKKDVASDYRATLSDAGPYFEGEFAAFTEYFGAVGNVIDAAVADDTKNNRQVRLSFDSAIEKLARLVDRYPDNFLMRSELTFALMQRAQSLDESNRAQALADLSTVRKLGLSLQRESAHPYHFCKQALSTSYLEIRLLSGQANPDLGALDDYSRRLRDYCMNELKQGFGAGRFIASLDYYKNSAAWKHIKAKSGNGLKEKSADNIETAARFHVDVEARRGETFTIFDELKARGASENRIASQKLWSYLSTNEYFDLLSLPQQSLVLEQALTLSRSLNDTQTASQAGNISWLMTTKGKVYESLGRPDDAIVMYRETERFCEKYCSEKRTTLLTNSIWAKTQEIRLLREAGDWAGIVRAGRGLFGLIEGLDLEATPELAASVRRFWRDTQAQLQQSLSKLRELNDVSEKSVSPVDLEQLVGDSALRLKGLGSVADVSPVEITYPDFNMQDLSVGSLIKGSRSNATATVTLGWFFDHVYKIPTSYTVSGDDERVNEKLDMPDLKTYRVRFSELEFYSNARLVTAEYINELGERFIKYFLENTSTGELAELKGRSPVIHKANAEYPIRLDSIEQAASYLRFFTLFVQGEQGAFQLVESVDELNWQPNATEQEKNQARDLIRSVHLWQEESQPDNWFATATVNYGTGLFYGKFKILPTGMVEMLGDRPLVANLSINSFSIATNDSSSSNFTNRLSLDIIKDIEASDIFDEAKMMQSHFERLEERQRKEHLRTHFFLSEVHRLAPEHASTRVRFRDARRFFSSVYALLESEQDRRQFERQRNVVFSAWANEYESRLAAGEASHLSVSFYKLFAGDFEGALESALGGLEKKPDDLALMTNYAHALMFLDRREEAMEAYRQHATDQVDGRVWWEIIEDDFEQLEGVGWTHPVMREIRDYFATLAEDAA